VALERDLLGSQLNQLTVQVHHVAGTVHLELIVDFNVISSIHQKNNQVVLPNKLIQRQTAGAKTC
jgi:hypothetical protein